MKNESELLELFKVEELEKRYEMGWVKSVEIEVSCDTQGNCGGSVKAKL